MSFLYFFKSLDDRDQKIIEILLHSWRTSSKSLYEVANSHYQRNKISNKDQISSKNSNEIEIINCEDFDRNSKLDYIFPLEEHAFSRPSLHSLQTVFSQNQNFNNNNENGSGIENAKLLQYDTPNKTRIVALKHHKLHSHISALCSEKSKNVKLSKKLYELKDSLEKMASIDSEKSFLEKDDAKLYESLANCIERALNVSDEAVKSEIPVKMRLKNSKSGKNNSPNFLKRLSSFPAELTSCNQRPQLRRCSQKDRRESNLLDKSYSKSTENVLENSSTCNSISPTQKPAKSSIQRFSRTFTSLLLKNNKSQTNDKNKQKLKRASSCDLLHDQNYQIPDVSRDKYDWPVMPVDNLVEIAPLSSLDASQIMEAAKIKISKSHKFGF